MATNEGFTPDVWDQLKGDHSVGIHDSGYCSYCGDSRQDLAYSQHALGNAEATAAQLRRELAKEREELAALRHQLKQGEHNHSLSDSNQVRQAQAKADEWREVALKLQDKAHCLHADLMDTRESLEVVRNCEAELAERLWDTEQELSESERQFSDQCNYRELLGELGGENAPIVFRAMNRKLVEYEKLVNKLTRGMEPERIYRLAGGVIDVEPLLKERPNEFGHFHTVRDLDEARAETDKQRSKGLSTCRCGAPAIFSSIAGVYACTAQCGYEIEHPFRRGDWPEVKPTRVQAKPPQMQGHLDDGECMQSGPGWPYQD